MCSARNQVAATSPQRCKLNVFRDANPGWTVKIGEQPEDILAAARGGRGGLGKARAKTPRRSSQRRLAFTSAISPREHQGLIGQRHQGALVTPLSASPPPKPARRGDVITRIGSTDVIVPPCDGRTVQGQREKCATVHH